MNEPPGFLALESTLSGRHENFKNRKARFPIIPLKIDQDERLLSYSNLENSWLPVCVGDSNPKELADNACYELGFWKSSSFSVLDTESQGSFVKFNDKKPGQNFLHEGTTLVSNCNYELSISCEQFPCGQQLHDITSPQTRIVGGQTAKAKEYPWTVSLLYSHTALRLIESFSGRDVASRF